MGALCSETGPEPEPECKTTFDGMQNYANSKGGINGYKIKVDTCDVGPAALNPSVDTQCYTQLIDEDHVMAIMANNGGTGLTTYLAKAKIPSISPIDVTSEFDDSPYSYPVYYWNGAGWNALIDYLATNNYKAPGMTNPENQLGVESVGAIQKGWALYGYTHVYQVVASLTGVSFQSQVLALQDNKIGSVMTVLAIPQILDMIQESQAIGYYPAWPLLWDTVDQRINKILAPVSQKSTLIQDSPFNTIQNAGALMKSTLDTYAPGGETWEYSFISENNWVGMEILFQALTHMSGPATAASLMNQLNTGTFTSEWLPATVSWAGIQPGECRIAGNKNLTYVSKMTNGVWNLLPGNPVNPKVTVSAGCTLPSSP